MDNMYKDCSICGSKAEEHFSRSTSEYTIDCVWICCSGCGLLGTKARHLKYGFTEQDKLDAFTLCMLDWNNLNPVTVINKQFEYKDNRIKELDIKLKKLSRVIYALFKVEEVHTTDDWTIDCFIDRFIKKHYVNKKEKKNEN